MKDRIRRIDLWQFDGTDLKDTDLEQYCYRLIGLVQYQAIGGQGDVEFRWVYLCKNADDKPVLITEEYNISWWSGPDPNNVNRSNLHKLTEEVLTQSEFRHYQSLAKFVGEEMVHLPITLCLPKPPVTAL
ncbi:MAG: hypothetical protein IJW67_02965 [Blautia sp.]|nr:hypothetical protein [Blautia sp.]